MVDAAVDDQLRAAPGALARFADAGDGRVKRFCRLDIEADPVDQRQDFLQALRIDAGAVQADLEAQRANFLDGGNQRRLQRRFAAAEHHGVEQAASPLQALDDC